MALRHEEIPVFFELNGVPMFCAMPTHAERNSGRSHAAKGFRILHRGECSMKGDFVLRMQPFEAIHELAPKHRFEHVNRQEEFRLRVDHAVRIQLPQSIAAK